MRKESIQKRKVRKVRRGGVYTERKVIKRKEIGRVKSANLSRLKKGLFYLREALPRVMFLMPSQEGEKGP